MPRTRAAAHAARRLAIRASLAKLTPGNRRKMRRKRLTVPSMHIAALSLASAIFMPWLWKKA